MCGGGVYVPALVFAPDKRRRMDATRIKFIMRKQGWTGPKDLHVGLKNVKSYSRPTPWAGSEVGSSIEPSHTETESI